MAESPEKKLLEIIETGKSAQGAPAGPQPGEFKAVPQARAARVREIKRPVSFNPARMLKDLQSGAAGLKSNFVSGLKGIFEFKRLNKILMFACVVLVVYMGIYIAQYQKSAAQEIVFANAPSGPAGQGEEASARSAILGSDYLNAFLDKLHRRDLFKPITAARQEGQNMGTVEAKAAALIKNLKLVGVSPSTNPAESYAMIEDSSTGVTNFFKKDDSVQGMHIAEIKNDRVILSYQDIQLELR